MFTLCLRICFFAALTRFIGSLRQAVFKLKGLDADVVRFLADQFVHLVEGGNADQRSVFAAASKQISYVH
tara:strand:- start:369 stop:578 length:210 start_codon:yes stop_codon:yes gene_type:complete